MSDKTEPKRKEEPGLRLVISGAMLPYLGRVVIVRRPKADDKPKAG